jgi:DNA-binding winged helix-turn-helix (wHTH) protein
VRFALGDFVLDEVGFELRRRSGERVAVEPLVLRLVAYLARHPHRLVTREELIETVWDGQAVSDWAIARAVKEARRALGDSGREQRAIETVRGQGYRFAMPVSILRPLTAPRQRRTRRPRVVVRHDGRLVHAVTSAVEAGPYVFFGSMWDDRIGVRYVPPGGAGSQAPRKSTCRKGRSRQGRRGPARR